MGREVRRVPANWQHPNDDKGRPIPLLDGSFATADAVCFCGRGAVLRIGGGPIWGAVENDAAVALGFSNPAAFSRWNDAGGRTQKDVVARLRNGAALAREQGQ